MSFIALFENVLIQAVCLILFVFLLVYVLFAVLNKLFPNWKDKIKNVDLEFNLRCHNLYSHNVKDLNDDTKCVWCGKTVKELKG